MRFYIALTVLMSACVTAAFLAHQHPNSMWGRVMLRTFGARPRKRFGTIKRSDILKNAFATLLVAILCFAFAVAAGTIESTAPNLSGINVLASAAVFIFSVLGLMGLAGAGIVLVRALMWRPAPARPFNVFASEDLIGETDLDVPYWDEGLIMGQFFPKPGYATVEQCFRPLRGAVPGTANRLAQSPEFGWYRKEISSLGLRIETASGEVAPAHAVHVVDLSHEGGRQLFRLEVDYADPKWWQSRGPGGRAV